MGATHTPPIVASTGEDGADVGVPGRHRATDEEVAGAVSPHLDAAYNLARWLARDPDDARDAVLEAVRHAARFLASRKGGDTRPWLLATVRDAALASRAREQRAEVIPFAPDRGEGMLDGQLRRLPPELREVLVLRELEGLAYKEIAAVAGIPIGTVMSRLARARQLLLARDGEPAPGERGQGA